VRKLISCYLSRATNDPRMLHETAMNFRFVWVGGWAYPRMRTSNPDAGWREKALTLFGEYVYYPVGSDSVSGITTPFEYPLGFH